MPEVSIVVPSYNHACYLENRLASIVAQGFNDYQLILLDDASTDGSCDICQRFSRLHACELVINEVNSGSPFAQWSKGISLATGRYIWIAESDDYSAPSFLESMVGLLDQHPECDLAYCNSLRIDSDGNLIGPVSQTFSAEERCHWDCDYVSDGQSELRNFMLLENTIPNASGVLFRRSAYDAVGGVDQSMFLCADWKLWATMLSKSGVAYCAKTMNYFRSHQSSVRFASKTWPTLAEQLTVMRHSASLAGLTTNEIQNLRIRVWVLILDAIMKKRPATVDLQAAFRVAQDIGLRLSFTSTGKLLARILEATRKRIFRS